MKNSVLLKTGFAFVILLGGVLAFLFFPSSSKGYTTYYDCGGRCTFGGGVYTNLCGSATAANIYNCPAFCNPNTGICGGAWVAKWTCDGKVTDCSSNEQWFEATNAVVNSPAPGCGKTVQLDVFTKKCRDSSGNWICTGACGWTVTDCYGYMAWYSGDCPTQGGCSAITVYANPSIVTSGNQIVFKFSSDIGYTDITINSGGGTTGACTYPGYAAACGGSCTGDHLNCWCFTCTAKTVTASTNYTATFNGKNPSSGVWCSKNVSYTVKPVCSSCSPEGAGCCKTTPTSCGFFAALPANRNLAVETPAPLSRLRSNLNSFTLAAVFSPFSNWVNQLLKSLR